MIAGGEIVHQVSQFSERHIDKQQRANDVVQGYTAAACRTYQIENGEQLESGGQRVGDVVVGIGEAFEVFGHGAPDEQDVPAQAGDGKRSRDDEAPVAALNPAVEEREQGEQESEQAEECADVEQHAGRVAGNVQVGRLLVLRQHGRGVGIDNGFCGVAALLGHVIGFSEAHDANKMHEQTAEAERCRRDGDDLHDGHGKKCLWIIHNLRVWADRPRGRRLWRDLTGRVRRSLSA